MTELKEEQYEEKVYEKDGPYDVYIGAQMIYATPCKSWGQVGFYMEGSEGYKILHEDGYQSWKPKEVFEKIYRRL